MCSGSRDGGRSESGDRLALIFENRSGWIQADLGFQAAAAIDAVYEAARCAGLAGSAHGGLMATAVTRVIGIGAEDGGDDAAGLLVARLLRVAASPGVEVHESAGDAGGLLELLEGADRVVLVDAARGAGAPGTVEHVPLGATLRPRVYSTHGLGLAEALGVASELGILPLVVRVYIVYGRAFEPGPVTPEVAAGIGPAAGLILREELAPPGSG